MHMIHIFTGRHAHTQTHMAALAQTRAYYGACVQTALSAVPHQVSILKRCEPIPDSLVSLSLSLSSSALSFLLGSAVSSQRGAAAVALRGHTVGSIISPRAEGNYQVV